jgi:hypothetical protein
MKKLSLLAPALAMVLLGAGCAGGASTTSSTSGSSNTSVKAGVQLPADFPAAIPVYERGTVDAATSDSLDVSTSDSMEDAYDWYAGKLMTAGWTATVENKKEKNISAVWEKGNQSMPISVYTAGGSTYISVSLSTY